MGGVDPIWVSNHISFFAGHLEQLCPKKKTKIDKKQQKINFFAKKKVVANVDLTKED